MRGSLKIAKLFGIPIYVHWSFWLLFLFVAYIGKNWHTIAFLSFYVLALFVCVVLHEFGHAISARWYGVDTRDITILPIGGLARLDKMPEKPLQEFVVAVAGPAVNLVIAVVLIAALYFFHSFKFGLDDIDIAQSETGSLQLRMIYALLYSNIGLVVFNMIPAFPMDGGRVLRALLSIRLGRAKATYIATILGQFFSICFIIYALLPLLITFIPANSDLADTFSFINWDFQPVLALISYFIFSTARSEYRSVRLEETLSNHPISNILRTQYTSFRTNDLVQSAASEMSKGFETDFLVFDDEQILRGVLQEEDIMDAIKHKQYDASIFTYMTHEFKTAGLQDSIKEVYYKMLQSGQYLMPVFQHDALVGVVDMRMVQHFIKFQQKVK